MVRMMKVVNHTATNKAERAAMNAKYPRLELHTGTHGAVEICDLARASIKTQTPMKVLFNALERYHGVYTTEKFAIYTCPQA